MHAKVTDNGPRLVIISPGFNCSKFIELWWNSLKVQNYKKWIAIAIDDMSTDDTFDKLMKIANSDENGRLYVTRNRTKKYQLKNWYDIIHGLVSSYNTNEEDRNWVSLPHIRNSDIILFHDLDDWFGTKYAFELTVKEYLYRDIWCTTARNFCMDTYYQVDAEMYTYREQCNAPIHQFSLSSYKARLFMQIPKEHFIDPDTSEFYRVCGDYAITMPILYMAGPEHHQHLFVDNYVIYNNIRLECDDNKVTSEGVSEHEIARKKLHESFLKIKDNLILN